MKKAVVLMLVVMCAFMFVACGEDVVSDKTEVYTFYGENEYISVINGTAVIDGDEEMFSGGMLKTLKADAFSDAVYWDAEFYIARSGENVIVYKSTVSDETGDAEMSIDGDLGKISGGNVITKYGEDSAEDFINNLFLKFTVRDADGEENVYELHMTVDKVY